MPKIDKSALPQLGRPALMRRAEGDKNKAASHRFDTMREFAERGRAAQAEVNDIIAETETKVKPKKQKAGKRLSPTRAHMKRYGSVNVHLPANVAARADRDLDVVLSTRLGPDLKRRFDLYMKVLNGDPPMRAVKPAEALRRLLDEHLPRAKRK